MMAARTQVGRITADPRESHRDSSLDAMQARKRNEAEARKKALIRSERQPVETDARAANAHVRRDARAEIGDRMRTGFAEVKLAVSEMRRAERPRPAGGGGRRRGHGAENEAPRALVGCVESRELAMNNQRNGLQRSQ